MKIGKVELTQEKLIAIVAAGFLLIAFVVYLIFYVPLTRDLRRGFLECRELESEALECRNIIASAGKIYEERVLLTEKEISKAIDELTKYGKWKRVNFVSMNPRKIIEEKGSEYKRLPVKIEIKSGYEQLGMFLGSLDDLEKSLIKVKSFNIIPGKEDADKVITNLLVEIYFSGSENAE